MIADGSLPQPIATAATALPIAGPRRPWYRRPRRVIPVALILIALATAAVLGYRTLAALDTVQSLSTPPPELSGAALGGEADLVIDTGPAREAVRQQQELDRQSPDSKHGLALAPTGTDATGTVTPTPTPAPFFGPILPTTTPTLATAGTAAPPAPTDPPAPLVGPQPTATTEPLPTREPTEDDGTTILLMGVDARDGESIDVGVRPDALAVLHLDDSGSCRMLAVPRDSRAELSGYGQSKINHALAVGGIPYELQVVETYLGLDIDHYGLVDFAGVTQIVDSVGGIAVDNPTAFSIDGQQFAAGPLQLDGERALLYARYRGGSDGDFGRIGKQQQVLRAVLDRATDVNLVTLVPRSFTLLSDHIRTDLGPADLVDFATDHLDTCTAESLETRTIPGDVVMAHDDLMGMQLSFVVTDPAVVRDQVDWLLALD